MVDVADLDLKDEADLLLPLLQSVEARLCRGEFGLEFSEIGRMREVSRSEERNSLLPRPTRERLHLHFAARRATVPGVEMQVSDKGHRPP